MGKAVIMCESCGCNENEGYKIIHHDDINTNGHYPHNVHSHSHGHDHYHDHDHNDFHEHSEDSGHSHSHTHEKINIETDILYQNNLLAQRNRGFFEAKNITCFNLVSSPGSGKTTLLEKTIKSVNNRQVYVIEGDQQTTLDSDRIYTTGASVVQVNTGNGCHLDSEMINNAVKKLNPANNSLLFIENVGNLVCPALFDLGEKLRVVIISSTEGEDKPLKYPNMFQSSHICIINKTDLIPYLDFKIDKLKENALKVNRDLKFIALSAKTGEGFGEWMELLDV